MELLNDPRPWTGLMRGRPLTIVELMANSTIPPAPLAAVWWAMSRGASVFVVAGPSGIGKTTLAGALLTFLPENARIYTTSGPTDPMNVQPAADAPTYLLINELSRHTHLYLYGEAAQKAFAKLDEGVRVLGALHARSVSEAVQVMHHEADATASQIGQVTLVMVLSGLYEEGEFVRRVAEIGLLSAEGESIHVGGIATWSQETQALELEPEACEHLAEWASVDVAVARLGVSDRAEILQDLADQDADQELIEQVVQSTPL